MAPRCTCGSTRLEDAALEGAALRLEGASTLKKVFNVGGIIRFKVCLDCGLVGDMRADPEALAKMLE